MQIFRPLQIRSVAFLWSGLTLSAIGDQLYAVALSWVAVELLGANAGYVSALQSLTLLVAALGIGRLSDGWESRASMIGADLARAASLALLVGLWLVAGGPSVWTLTIAVVILAAGQAVFLPALQTMLPALVEPRELLPAANGLFDATDRSARLIGPGLVAIVAGSVPVVHFFTIDAISFIGSATALLLIAGARLERQVKRIVEPRRIWQSIARGWTAAARHPLLGYVLATTGLNNGAWYAVFYLGLPLMISDLSARSSTGGGLGTYGLIISCYGCTNLASTIVFGSRPMPVRPQRQMFFGNCIVGVGIILIALTCLLPPNFIVPALAAAAAFGAIGGPMKNIPVAVLRQTRIAQADRPSAMRAYMVMNSAGLLLAMTLASMVIAVIGVVGLVVTGGLVMILIGALGLVRHWSWIELRFRLS